MTDFEVRTTGEGDVEILGDRYGIRLERHAYGHWIQMLILQRGQMWHGLPNQDVVVDGCLETDVLLELPPVFAAAQAWLSANAESFDGAEVRRPGQKLWRFPRPAIPAEVAGLKAEWMLGGRVRAILVVCDGRAQFDRGDVIVERDRRYFRMHGAAVAAEVTNDDVEALVYSHQATRLPDHYDYEIGHAAWVIRGYTDEAEELRAPFQKAARGDIAIQVGTGDTDELEDVGGFSRSTLYLVTEDEQDEWLWRHREVAAATAHARALSLLELCLFRDALRLARFAFVVRHAMDPKDIGLLVYLCRRLGEPERADSYLSMARNSLGTAIETPIHAYMLKVMGHDRSPEDDRPWNKTPPTGSSPC